MTSVIRRPYGISRDRAAVARADYTWRTFEVEPRNVSRYERGLVPM
jgi:hypothetical protein